MKSLVELLRRVTQDLGNLCCVSTHRDLQTISKRVQTEGLSFLTITLPTFSKGLERALDDGVISSSLFPGFKPWKKGSRIPAFLQEFTKLVFDPWTGLIMDEPSKEAILAIRQISLMYKKYRSPCSPKRERKAFEQFVLTDLDVRSQDAARSDHSVAAFSEMARILFDPILSDLEKTLTSVPLTLVPRHGPGATAEKVVANRKYDSRLWTERLQRHFDHWDYLPNFGEDTVDEVGLLSARNETPVRVVSVPKTLKAPRIIGIEPVYMQYVQQAILEVLAPLLESRAMHDSIGIRDQTINIGLARTSSVDQKYATLDLSEASDRVSNQLVRALFSSYPTLDSMVQSCRSVSADVPGHGVIPLAKFASMGSALCFPVEAMVFLTIIALGFSASGRPVDRKSRKRFLSDVRVYGDDIIVPVDMALSVMRELENFGLQVNRSKSFWTGLFRESCGGDFFNGVAVKPLYLKTDVPTSLADTTEIETTVAFRNAAYLRGFSGVCSFIDNSIKRFAPFPVVSERSPVLGRVEFGTPKGTRLCSELHVPIVRGMIPRRRIPESPISGPGALMKFFLKRGESPIFGSDHLVRAGRPKSADIRLGWGRV